MKPRHPITCLDQRPTAAQLARRDLALAVTCITCGSLALILVLVVFTAR